MLVKDHQSHEISTPFFKKPDNPPQPPEPPHMDFNLDSFSNDSFFSYHQQNHPERTCPQWVNSMTLVINQLLDQQSLDDEIHAQVPSDTSNENPPESTMPFWDWCVESDDEQIEEILTEIHKLLKSLAPKGITCTTKVHHLTPHPPKKKTFPLEK
jgi:hypothetical protein